MAMRENEIIIKVGAKKDYVLKYILNIREMIKILPREYVRILDVDRSIVELTLRRGLFTLRDTFSIRVESASSNTIVYRFVSPRYIININFNVASTGEEESSVVRVTFDGTGFNVGRFVSKLSDLVEKWVRATKTSVEAAYEAEARKPRGSREAQEYPPTPTQPAPSAAKESVSKELLPDSKKLADPLFEAEILVRGSVVSVETRLVTSLPDIIERVIALEGFDRTKTYYIKVTIRDVEAAILIRQGRMTGIMLRRGGELLFGIEAVKVFESVLPGEALLTIMEM